MCFGFSHTIITNLSYREPRDDGLSARVPCIARNTRGGLKQSVDWFTSPVTVVPREGGAACAQRRGSAASQGGVQCGVSRKRVGRLHKVRGGVGGEVSR